MPRAGPYIRAVSYTHLDVYKRQGYERYLNRITRSGSRYETMMYKVDMLRSLASGYRDVYAFAQRIEDFGALCREKNRAVSNLTLSTVHASKGLEFDQVILIDLLEGRFPSDVAIQSHVEGVGDALEEETRLFYAVSYTHLDVYKRQGEGRPLKDFFLPERLPDSLQYHMGLIFHQ